MLYFKHSSWGGDGQRLRIVRHQVLNVQSPHSVRRP